LHTANFIFDTDENGFFSSLKKQGNCSALLGKKWLKPDAIFDYSSLFCPKYGATKGNLLFFHIIRHPLRKFVEPQCIAALRLPYQPIRNHLILADEPVKPLNFSLFDVLNIMNMMRGYAPEQLQSRNICWC